MARRAGEAWLGTHDVLLHEPMAVRLRAFDGGRTAVDSNRAQVVWEPGRLVPYYAVPEQDVRAGLRPIRRPPPDYADHSVEVTPGLRMLPPGMFRLHTVPGEELAVEIGGRWREGRAFRLEDADLPGYVVLEFSAFDRWLEEEEPAVGHPRDPFKRIDVRRTARHVRIESEGVLLAESHHPSLLVETMLPPRWYLPVEDVRTGALLSSTSRTVCAYKGFADYWAVATQDGEIDICWTYRDPFTDAEPVKDMIAFYNEHIDVIVDGELRPRPVSPWSRPTPRGGGHLP